jgi:hypothetical protein
MGGEPPRPDFGDELGLYRLVRWAKARVRASALASPERAAILAEIERQYRAVLEGGVAERQASEKPADARARCTHSGGPASGRISRSRQWWSISSWWANRPEPTGGRRSASCSAADQSHAPPTPGGQADP